MATLPLLAVDLSLGGEDSWDELQAYLMENGLIEVGVDDGSWFSERFLPEVDP